MLPPTIERKSDIGLLIEQLASKNNHHHRIHLCVMFVENRRRLYLVLLSIFLAIGIYPVSFDGKQVLSLDAPLTSTFEVLVNHLWNFHPFIIHVKELVKINATCSSYQIEDRIPVLPLFQISFPTTYYAETNIDRTAFCISSHIRTQLNIMHAYHQYCMHANTLKPSAIIITDQFHGQSWMIFKWYIRRNMFISHKYTLDRLRKEMMIYSSE